MSDDIPFFDCRCLFLIAVEVDFGKLVAFKHNIIHLDTDYINNGCFVFFAHLTSLTFQNSC